MSRQKSGTVCTLYKNTSLRRLSFFLAVFPFFSVVVVRCVRIWLCFLVNAGKESRKQESGVCSLMFPPGSILRWQEPYHWLFSLYQGSAACQFSRTCFYM